MGPHAPRSVSQGNLHSEGPYVACGGDQFCENTECAYVHTVFINVYVVTIDSIELV